MIVPHPVQVEALKRSNRARGFAYYMEQGLGKTSLSYLDFLDLLSERLATRMLVVAPNSFKGGWVKEAEKQGIADKFDFFVWESGSETLLRAFIRKKFDRPPCVIVNWETVRPVRKKEGKKTVYQNTAVCEILIEYVQTMPTMVIWDESIKAKDPSSLSTIGAIQLAMETLKSGGYSRDLSGKPISQGPQDLHGQMQLIGQQWNRNYYAWKTLFCVMGGYQMKKVMRAQNEDIMRSWIEPHLFRATKDEWAKEIPLKDVPTIREYKLTPEMHRMYKQMETEFVIWLNEQEYVSVDHAITKYLKLAQIQAGWIYDNEGKIQWLVEDDKNPRLQALMTFVDEELTGKLAIPYHHKPVFQQLLRSLGGDQQVAWITGGMSSNETEEQKRRFNEDPSVKFILLQDEASKYGHTLLGQQGVPGLGCYTMAFYESTYNLDTRSQIEDRIHRHGQTFPAWYVDFSGTKMDRNFVEALQRKEDIFQTVFSPLKSRPSQ